jgi:putative FmdB family regulatory protein
MPTYEYACTSCGEHLEVVQSFKDDPLTTCPACQGSLRKVFSPIGVVFKGSGFYKTDSRSSASGGRAASSDAGSSAASTASTDTASGSSAAGGSGGATSGAGSSAGSGAGAEATPSSAPTSSAAAAS